MSGSPRQYKYIPTKTKKKILQELIDVLHEYGVTSRDKIPDLLDLYGAFGYSLGASLSGVYDDPPSVEDLKRAYYLNPTVDLALMQQGMLIAGWAEDFIDKPEFNTTLKERRNQK
jgi:hypothetical protein